MGLRKFLRVILLCWVLSVFYCLKAVCDDASEVTVKFLKAPPSHSNMKSATFVFEALAGNNEETFSLYTFNCKLDGGISSDCRERHVSFSGLLDGDHTFKVCANTSQGVGCASYYWTVDTIPPTAYVGASTSFTNASNISVYISFSEPCIGAGGGFGCFSVNACNLLVYGAGQVIPYTLKILQPNLKYSVIVNLPSTNQYGRAILVMDKGFCTDYAGNEFTRTENSSLTVHFDRRSVFVRMRTHVPERLLQINDETRTVQATNNYKYLKLYLYFTQPVLNTSYEILNTLNLSEGMLHPIAGKSLGNRRFGYQIENLSSIAVVTVRLNSNAIISRQGTPVSPVAPATFLYDSKRPAVTLSAFSKMRTRESSITILIKFVKPVFGFNSTAVSISGGHLRSFHEISRNAYVAMIQPQNDIVHVKVPENVTADVAGNKNRASNVLEVRHYLVPTISTLFVRVTTASFMATCLAAGLLTISTASLQSIGVFSKSLSPPSSDPTRNLFRIAFYIQVFALSKWLVVTLPVDYYEFVRGLQWSIPYFNLPWEAADHTYSAMLGTNTSTSSYSFVTRINGSPVSRLQQPKEEDLKRVAAVYGSPLTAMEYSSFFENQNTIPEAEYISDAVSSNGWRDFKRSMFWLGVITGSLMLLHALLLLLLRFRESSGKERSYGALVCPRFEIFLIILGVPCICEAAVSIIKGGTHLGTAVGVLLLGLASALQLALFVFLSVGIMFGKLLRYKEIHQEGQQFHWYQEIIRATLGPGKRGQWEWKNQHNSVCITMFGPLFEDLRGPPKYMLSQFSGGISQKPADQIIASDDETEDAEAPFIQKLFGILRIYYTLLESIKRFSLGIVAGAFSGDRSSKAPIIALLCITLFQLFFLGLKKPYIKKRVQLVEIISISCEVGIFAACFILLEKEFSSRDERKVGISMLILFLIGYLALAINEWNALYRQIIQLDSKKNSLRVGLKTASVGFLFLFIPQRMIGNLANWFPDRDGDRETGPIAYSAERFRQSSRARSDSRERPWLKQLREMARASFTREGISDPSTSHQTRWSRSGFWRQSSESSSKISSTDYKSKPRELHKDLEAIFASR